MDSKVILHLLACIAIVVIGFALYFVKTLAIPLVTALFFFMILSPGVRWLKNEVNIPAWIAKLLMLFAALATVGLFFLFLVYAIDHFAQFVGDYQKKLLKVAESIFQRAPGIDVPWNGGDNDNLPVKEIMSAAKDVTSVIAKTTSAMGLVLVFLIFMLFSEEQKNKPKVLRVIEKRVSRYIFIKTALSLLSAIIAGAVFFGVGLELAFAFAILVFVLNFIPSVGSIISSLLPLPVAFVQFGFDYRFWLVMIIPIVAENIVGNVIEPHWMGDRFGIHPIVLLSSLILWGILWGIPGAFLAVPITVFFLETAKALEMKKTQNFLEGSWF